MNAVVTILVLLVAVTAVSFGWLRVELWLEARDRARYAADEPEQFDSRDEIAEHFESAKRALMDLLPATPLHPPALGRWKEIEADLCSDPTFVPAVDAALRDPNQT